ncbi:MAG TPA: UDP-N-acetylglucosamine 2-epimerase [Limnobacter sp.]|nr:UDP-N-acetylglucosamine 2-epimerase [Limnobacter sp.]
MRKVCYLTGTRADFGLMQKTLQAIHACPSLELQVIACGMHLSRKHGYTVEEIERSGLPIFRRLCAVSDESSGYNMGVFVGKLTCELMEAFDALKPDCVLLLGDRGEMLAGAIAAIHLGIPIVHVHGGERSGTIDEPVRHAVSKLSHYHFTATEQARSRLVQMGELPAHVWVTGAPGLDGIQSLKRSNRPEICKKFDFREDAPLALMVFHPVVQEAAKAAEQMKELLQCLFDLQIQTVMLYPNADAGSDEIRSVLENFKTTRGFKLVQHLSRPDYIDTLANVDFLIGNSSSGIIEAASFDTTVVNVGSRQMLREHGDNVLDCNASYPAVHATIQQALGRSRRDAPFNLYGQGGTAGRIVELLERIDLTPSVLNKVNAY